MTTVGRLMEITLTTDYTDDTDAGKSYRVFPMKFPAKLVLGCVMLGLFAVPAWRAQGKKLRPEDREFVEKSWPEAKKPTTGIRFIIIREGGGESPKPGDRV